VYGELSSCYDRGNGHIISPSPRIQCTDPRHDLGGGREGPETGGLLCPRVHRQTSKPRHNRVCCDAV
jgi:hypothetical protein